MQQDNRKTRENSPHDTTNSRPSPKLPQLGNYKIIREIARGGMGIVYLGQNQMGMKVAIKVLLNPHQTGTSAVERFDVEAKVASRLAHPNIVRVIDGGMYQNRKYLVMEYIEGRDLEDIIEKEGPLDVKKALAIMKEVARAIHYAHENSVLHRDLKTANILMTGDHRPMVTDFGIAKDLKDDRNLTQTGTVMGSPEYMAPEQVEGKAPDRRTDVYAMGIIMYELLTGKLPYTGSGAGMIYTQILKSPFPSIKKNRSEVPMKVEKICKKAMHRDRDRRYSTALELAEAIESYEHQSTVRQSQRNSQLHQLPDRQAQNRQMFIMIGVISFLVIAMGILAVKITQTSPEVAKKDKKTAGKKDKTSKDSNPFRDTPGRRDKGKTDPTPGPGKIPPGNRPTGGNTPKKNLPATTTQVKNLYRQAREAWKVAEFGKSLHLLKKLLDIQPHYSPALVLKLRCINSVGDPKEGPDIIRHVSEGYRARPDFKVAWAHNLTHHQKMDEGYKLIQTMSPESARDPDLWMLLAKRSWILEKNHLESIKYLKKGLQQFPRRLDLAVYHVNLWLRKKDYTRCIQLADEYMQKFPPHFDFYRIKGQALMSKWKAHEAVPLFRRAIQLAKNQTYPTHHSKANTYGIYYHLGKCYYYLKAFPQGVQAYREILRHRSSHSAAYFWMGKCYLGMKNTDKAIQVFEKAISVGDNGGGSYLILLDMYHKTKQYRKVIDLANRIEAKWPEFYQIYSVRGTARIKLRRPLNLVAKDFQTSLKMIQQRSRSGKKIRPDIAFLSFYGMGKTFFYSRKYDLALKYLRRSQRIEKTNPAPLFWIGRTYEGLKQYRKAVETYVEAMKINPHPDLAYRLASSYLKLNQLDRVIQLSHKFIQTNPDKVGFFLLRGVAFAKKGQRDRAIADLNHFLQKAPAKNPNRRQAQKLLGQLKNQ